MSNIDNLKSIADKCSTPLKVAKNVYTFGSDFYKYADGRISGKECAKRTTANGAGVAGGIGGAKIGTAIGAIFGPLGAAIGGFAGGIIGSVTAKDATKDLLD